MSISVQLTGFGGSRSIAFKDASSTIAEIIGKNTNYDMVSFTQKVDNLYAVNTKGLGVVISAASKEIELPTLGGILAKWQSILREISAAFEGTIVSIQINGITEAALGGKIFGIDKFD